MHLPVGGGTIVAAGHLTHLHPGTFGYPLLVFAFLSTSWARRPSTDDKLAIHASSISQAMARMAILATFGNGVAPDANHVLVGVIGAMYFTSLPRSLGASGWPTLRSPS